MMGRSRVIGNRGFLMAPVTRTALSDTLTLTVEGMSCASCVKRVETVAERVPGVVESSDTLANESLTVRAGPGLSVGAVADDTRRSEDRRIVEERCRLG